AARRRSRTRRFTLAGAQPSIYILAPFQSASPGPARSSFEAMNEKPESEDFDEEEDDGGAVDSEDLDVDHLIADLDKRKKTAARVGEPAWRRLERIREERETAEQLSDFDDYDIGDGDLRGANVKRRRR